MAGMFVAGLFAVAAILAGIFMGVIGYFGAMMSPTGQDRGGCTIAFIGLGLIAVGVFIGGVLIWEVAT